MLLQYRLPLQARTQQLLQQNRELLEHIAAIGGYQDSDRPGSGITPGNIGLAPQVRIQPIFLDCFDVLIVFILPRLTPNKTSPHVTPY